MRLRPLAGAWTRLGHCDESNGATFLKFLKRGPEANFFQRIPFPRRFNGKIADVSFRIFGIEVRNETPDQIYS